MPPMWTPFFLVLNYPKKTNSRRKDMKIRIGTNFPSKEVVVIQLSENIENQKEIAERLAEVLLKENIKRKAANKPLLSYKVETSGKLQEQNPEVVQGNFSFVNDGQTFEMLGTRWIFLGQRR